MRKRVLKIMLTNKITFVGIARLLRMRQEGGEQVQKGVGELEAGSLLMPEVRHRLPSP